MKKILLVVLPFLFASCSSLLKIKCEHENWFVYGQNKGLSGQDWHADPFPQSCSGAGAAADLNVIDAGYQQGLATYCTESSFNAAGVAGEAHSMAVCAPALQPKLSAAFQAGLARHCTKQGAFNRGKSGAPDLHVCPPPIQNSYDRYFNQGRVAYLQIQISNVQGRLAAIEPQQESLEHETHELEHRLERITYLAGKKDRSTSENIEYSLAQSPYRLKEQIQNNRKEEHQLREEAHALTQKIPALEAEMNAAAAQSVGVESGALDAE